MTVAFALPGRPSLELDDALGVAELLADHQLPAALELATEIRAAVLAEEHSGPASAPIPLDANKQRLLLKVLSEEVLLRGVAISVLRRSLARELASR